MRTVTLSNWQRLWLTVVVGSGTSPTIAQVRLGNKALDVLEMTDKEKVEVGWRALPDQQQVGWEKEKDWELTFGDDVWQLVQKYVKGFRQWSQDRRTETLYDKVMEGEDE